jgi:PPOX class probable F420-dependent enzyme
VLTEEDREMFRAKNFGHLATLMPDGSPQVSVVWVDVDGDTIVVNTAEGRVKTENMRRDPRVAMSITDHADPYTRLVIRGTVVEMTHEGAADHIDMLAKKYMDRDGYWAHDPAKARVLVRIRPDAIDRSA